MEINELGDVLHRTEHTCISRPLLLSVYQRDILHIRIHKPGHLPFILQGLFQLFLLLLRNILFQINASVIELNLGKLKLGNLIAGIFQPESYQHQRHTPADSKYGHEETLLIPHQIPYGGFPRKIKMPPDDTDTFQEHPPSILWGGRTHQYCRLCIQFPVAGHDRSKYGAEHRSPGRHHRIPPVIRHENPRYMLV